MTMLFADVTGSTALSERLDPERLRDVLITFFHAMREEIAGRAIESFERAREGFAALSARWEGARTDAFLAEALAAVGRDDDARARLKFAIEVFEELGAAGELRRAAELATRLS